MIAELVDRWDFRIEEYRHDPEELRCLVFEQRQGGSWFLNVRPRGSNVGQRIRRFFRISLFELFLFRNVLSFPRADTEARYVGFNFNSTISSQSHEGETRYQNARHVQLFSAKAVSDGVWVEYLNTENDLGAVPGGGDDQNRVPH